GDEVAFLRAVLAGDAVHDHRVRRDAERGREALVALRRRHAALRAEVLLGDAVELEHRHAGLERLGAELQRLVAELARARHALDLLGGLPDDRWPRPSSSSMACWISRHTSSMERSACTCTRLPVAR